MRLKSHITIKICFIFFVVFVVVDVERFFFGCSLLSSHWLVLLLSIIWCRLSWYTMCLLQIPCKQQARSQNIVSVSHLNHSAISFNIQIGLYFPRFYSLSPFLPSQKYVAPECSTFEFFFGFLFCSTSARRCQTNPCNYVANMFGFISIHSLHWPRVQWENNMQPWPKSDSCLFNCLASFE